SRAIKNPADAVAAANDGDTIEIDAGTYQNQILCVNQPNLTIRGVGGRAYIQNGVAGVAYTYTSKAAWCLDKGIITTPTPVAGQPQQKVLIDSMELSGMKSSGFNGAGIRNQGADMTIRNSYFHNNEDGVLAGANSVENMDIENSEFAFNGAGDGQSHNLYI